jgi:hypothetical protein
MPAFMTVDDGLSSAMVFSFMGEPLARSWGKRKVQASKSIAGFTFGAGWAESGC